MAPAVLQGKRQVLTLTQISQYDDILTDALVDKTFYSTTIPKNRTTYHASRGIREDEVTKIVQNHLIVEPDLELAAKKLLALDGLRKFHDALKSEKEKENFRQHLRRYARVYLPDCPFEVSTTNRYTIVSHEAAITARSFIKKGESIKHLSGVQVVITEAEEEEMTRRKKDFSIVVSSRNKCSSLFMGPARFANHDCDANARLAITNKSTIEIFAKRDIEVGDEITVTYGDNYFGEDNCECLCQTCEKNLANGWTQPGDEGVVAGMVKTSIEDTPEEGYSLRRRRRDDSTARSSRTPSRTPDVRPRISRSRTKLLRTDSSRCSGTGSPAPEAILRQKRKQDFAMLSSPPVTPAKRQKKANVDDHPIPAPQEIVRKGSEGGSICEGSGSSSGSNAGDSVTTDITTPDDEIKGPHLSLQSPKLTPMKPSMPGLKTEDSDLVQLGAQANDAFTSGSSEQLSTSQPLLTIEAAVATGIPAAEVSEMDAEVQIIPPAALDLIVIPPPLTPASNIAEQVLPQMGISEIKSPETAESTEQPMKRGRGRPKGSSRTKRLAEMAVVKAAAKATAEPNPGDSINLSLSDDESSDDTNTTKRIRTPGDYTLTPVLLAEANTAWIHCTVCNDAFVQHDAYFTKKYCPRCERHSKLYGYQWPKTQKEGKQDTEERVLDHREVHRFLDPEEEARSRGRKNVITPKYKLRLLDEEENKKKTVLKSKKSSTKSAPKMKSKPGLKTPPTKKRQVKENDSEREYEYSDDDNIELNMSVRRSGRKRISSLRA